MTEPLKPGVVDQGGDSIGEDHVSAQGDSEITRGTMGVQLPVERGCGDSFGKPGEGLFDLKGALQGGEV